MAAVFSRTRSSLARRCSHRDYKRIEGAFRLKFIDELKLAIGGQTCIPDVNVPDVNIPDVNSGVWLPRKCSKLGGRARVY